jgi:hypothetical protein
MPGGWTTSFWESRKAPGVISLGSGGPAPGGRSRTEVEAHAAGEGRKGQHAEETPFVLTTSLIKKKKNPYSQSHLPPYIKTLAFASF